MKIYIKNSDMYRGYTPLGKEFTNNQYDWHECVDFGPNFKKDNSQVVNPTNYWDQINGLRNHVI